MTANVKVRRFRQTVLVAAATLIMAAGAMAAGPGDISAKDARIRWLPGDLPLAGYLRLANAGESARTLTGARSEAFARVMVHRSVRKDGQTTMEHVGQLVIAPGESVTLEPGGLHLMLMKRQRELAPGDDVEIELRFGDGSTMPVRFRVVAADEG